MTDTNAMREAQQHAVELEQCALFIDSAPLRKAMTDAAAFLRAHPVTGVNDRLREALEWAIAEIEGRTRYDDPSQRDNACAAARAALDATAGAPPGDVIALVLAARAVIDNDGIADGEAGRNLDKALEAFASRICYDDEGGDLPEAHAQPCTCGSRDGADA